MMNDEFGFNQQPGYPQPDSQPQVSYAPPAVSYAPPAGGDIPPAGGDVPPAGGYVPPANGNVPPAGGYVPPAGGYAPPNGGYVPYRAKGGKGGGWIGFLRVFLWIWFGLVCLFGVIVCVGWIDINPVIGFLCFLGCVLVAFLSVAGGMVALDACVNIKRCATNSARILDLLQKK